VAEELRGRVADSAVEKASKVALQSLQEQHDRLSQDVERELSGLTLLRQYALSLLHVVEVPSPTTEQEELPSLQEIRAVQDQLERYPGYQGGDLGEGGKGREEKKGEWK